MSKRSGHELCAVFDRWMANTRNKEKALAAVHSLGQLDGRYLRRGERRQALVTLAATYAELIAVLRGVTTVGLASADTSRAISRARHELMWLLRQCEQLSYPEIAMATGRNDHTTTMHGVKLVEQRIVERPELRAELMALVQKPDGRMLRAVG